MHSWQKSLHTFRRIVKSASVFLATTVAVLAVVTALCSTALADIDVCKGGILDAGPPLGTQGPDLVIGPGTSCTVDGKVSKTYNFHNVYIFGDGMPNGKTAALMFNNATMDFYAANILVQNGGTLQATGIGANGETLTIHLYGDPGDPGVTCQKLDSGSNLVQDPTCGVPISPSDVWNSNASLVVHAHPMKCTKTSQIDPPTLLPGGVDDCFYQYAVFDSKDASPAYFGHKVLAVSYGGTINLSGYKGAQGGDDNDPSVLSSSWQRLNSTLKGGGAESSFQIGNPVTDWMQNDNIVVTSTDYLPGHAEQMQVSSVTGSTVNLVGKVMNPHWGQTYSLAGVPCQDPPDGSTTCSIGPDLLPGQKPADRNIDMRAAVGLLTRSIRIVSDGSKAGLPFSSGYYGGHSLALQGFLSYQVQGVEFYQLGQGGAKGHYPVHFHMARQVPKNTYVKDSSVWDSMTRWITIHATQGVTLARNVGYKSIGHGFYLEDGTEADNVLNTNLGVFARAAVANAQNNRSVPGILAEPKDYGAPNPYHSDWESPTIFWIMNGWNEFQYNFASSAGTCGACYWLLPGGISGPSQYEFFEGYAGQQLVIPFVGKPGFVIDQSGFTPLKKFVGNSCSSAMESFINIGIASACNGVSNIPNSGTLLGIDNPAAPPKGPLGADPYYPYLGGLRKSTLCTDMTNCANTLTNPPCTGAFGSEATCAVTTLERYTSSFNWAEKNFSALWLRLWWFLVENSAITDVQQGGITFVTGGGYTRSDIAQGFWSDLRKSALVGNTQLTATGGQPDNAYASSAGPFNPKGLQCDQPAPPGVPFCMSGAQGITYPTDAFSGNQRMVNIYDGPSYQERNAYLDIPVNALGNGSACTVNGTQQTCPSFKYLYGLELGLPADPASNPANPTCYLPNAAIAWKQSNGFFYPPAFHSDNLFFHNVGIRHFVIEPEFEPGTFFQTNAGAVKMRYCTYNSADMFSNFTDIDRQTVLNDDDGSLTGLLADLGSGATRETISVNEDPFFNAPTVTVECASDVHDKGNADTNPPGTANTSPYEYITTATIAKCGIGGAGCRVNLPVAKDCDTSTQNAYCAWGPACGSASGNQACYGVPLYRQYLTDAEWTKYTGHDPNFHLPFILMMGQGTGQRSTLTVNHGVYYIDDQISQATQLKTGATEWSIFQPNQTYYTYFLYGKSSMDQIYQMFVGKNLDPQTVTNSIKPYRVTFPDAAYQFVPPQNGDPQFLFPNPKDQKFYNPTTGLVTIEVKLSGYASVFEDSTQNFCQPASYCTWDKTKNSCGCTPGSECNPNDSPCHWGTKDLDCPTGGCFAFGITLNANFKPLDDVNQPPPAPMQYSSDPNYATNWGIGWDYVQNPNNPQCTYSSKAPGVH